ncbi:MAG: peptide deformylase [Deltaproteobacteria bacterium]|nr:peptide deformylase [Deltaproteobacteria bacterium]
MASLPILTYPDPLLKKRSSPIEKIDDEIMKLAENMLEAMYQAPGRGVGLAAPQVGWNLRLIVVDLNHKDEEAVDSEPIILVNPEIVESEGEVIFEESCLSVPGYTVDIPRAEKVIVCGLDLRENPVEVETGDLLAIVLQHEIDHLDGNLIIDHVSPLKRELYRRKQKKAQKEKNP